MKRLLLTLLVLTLLGMPLLARAEEPATAGLNTQVQTAPGEDATSITEETPATQADVSPPHFVLPPHYYVWAGFRFADIEGARRGAGEYIWPYSSAAGGFDLSYNPLPQRLDTALDWNNPYDYQAAFAYAFKDMFKLNYSGWSLWHNLDHFGLIGASPALSVHDDDPDADYHVVVRDNRIFLRLKWPNRAYHVFVDFRQYEKSGTIQQRFLTIITGDMKNSQSRDIDWITRQYNAGFNGHFGPVEMEYSHRIKTFEPHGDVALTYTGTDDVHNVVPNVVSNYDTLKLHTDLTGSVVASGMFVNGERKNNTSNTEVDFHRAYGDLTLIPLDHVTVAVKYRFNQAEETVPSVVGSTLGIPAFFTPPVPGTTTKPINTTINQAEVAIRYSPLSNLGFRADYTFKNTRRDNADQWDILPGTPPENVLPFQGIPTWQDLHKVVFGMNARPFANFDFRATAEDDYTEEPAYATDPNNAFYGKADASWTPSATVCAGAHYHYSSLENKSAQMSVASNNPGLYVMWTPAKNIFLGSSYDYFGYNDTRDIQLTEGTPAVVNPIQLPRDRVPYRDFTNIYTLSGGYSFSIPLTMESEFHQSWTSGRVRVEDITGIYNASGMGELVDQKIRETGGSITAKYTLSKGWSTSLTYKINDYQDLENKPQNGPQDGTAQVMLVMLSRKW